MPIMMRPNNKARRLAHNVMQHVQEFGEDAEEFDVKKSRAPLPKSGLTKDKNLTPEGRYGAYVGK